MPKIIDLHERIQNRANQAESSSNNQPKTSTDKPLHLPTEIQEQQKNTQKNSREIIKGGKLTITQSAEIANTHKTLKEMTILDFQILNDIVIQELNNLGLLPLLNFISSEKFSAEITNELDRLEEFNNLHNLLFELNEIITEYKRLKIMDYDGIIELMNKGLKEEFCHQNILKLNLSTFDETDKQCKAIPFAFKTAPLEKIFSMGRSFCLRLIEQKTKIKISGIEHLLELLQNKSINHENILTYIQYIIYYEQNQAYEEMWKKNWQEARTQLKNALFLWNYASSSHEEKEQKLLSKLKILNGLIESGLQSNPIRDIEEIFHYIFQAVGIIKPKLLTNCQNPLEIINGILSLKEEEIPDFVEEITLIGFQDLLVDYILKYYQTDDQAAKLENSRLTKQLSILSIDEIKNIAEKHWFNVHKKCKKHILEERLGKEKIKKDAENKLLIKIAQLTSMKILNFKKKFKTNSQDNIPEPNEFHEQVKTTIIESIEEYWQLIQQYNANSNNHLINRTKINKEIFKRINEEINQLFLQEFHKEYVKLNKQQTTLNDFRNITLQLIQKIWKKLLISQKEYLLETYLEYQETNNNQTQNLALINIDHNDDLDTTDSQVFLYLTSQIGAFNTNIQTFANKINDPEWGWQMSRKLDDIIQEFIDVKDSITSQHSRFVGQFTEMVARYIAETDICHNEENTEFIARKAYSVGVKHDIGKLFIDDKILKKQGKLDYKTEKPIMDLHSLIGAMFLISLGYSNWEAYRALNHHEWQNGEKGNGYPRKISENELLMIDLVLQAIDSLSAMAQRSRGYYEREGANLEEEYIIQLGKIILEYNHCSGTQFSPKAVDYIFQCFGFDAFVKNSESLKAFERYQQIMSQKGKISFDELDQLKISEWKTMGLRLEKFMDEHQDKERMQIFRGGVGLMCQPEEYYLKND